MEEHAAYRTIQAMSIGTGVGVSIAFYRRRPTAAGPPPGPDVYVSDDMADTYVTDNLLDTYVTED